MNDAQRLDRSFTKAAAEFEVPRALLEAVGYAETRWSMHGGGPSNDGGYGLMHVVDRGDGSPVLRAAALLGVTPERVRTDSDTNVRAAAALLREDADRYFAETPGKDPRDPAAWWQIVMRWSGAADPEVADLYATTVYRVMGRGEGAALADGSWYESRPLEVDVGSEKLFGEMEFPLSPDYPSAAWRAANSNIYTDGRSHAIDHVVIHTAQGSYTGTINWFQNPSAGGSAHYVVSNGGAITGMVHDSDTAWHAGNWDMNTRSVGIEHEGFVDNPSWVTEPMYQASANLTRWLCDTYGVPKDRQHVIGHYEVPGCSTGRGGGSSCHTDPGYFDSSGFHSYWDWAHYMELVGGTTTPATGKLTGFVFSTAGGSAPSGNTAPILGATVTIRETGATTTTSSNGSFTFNLPAGMYHPKATAPGYADAAPWAGVDCGAGNGDKTCRPVTAGGTTYSSFVLTPVATDTTNPVVTFTSPEEGATAFEATVEVAGTVSEALLGLQVNDEGSSHDVEVAADGSFRVTVALRDGENTIQAHAADLSGNVGTATLHVTRAKPGAGGVVKDAVSGDALAEAVVSEGAKFVKTGTDGRWALDLSPGAHTLAVQATGYVLRSVKLSVPEAGRLRRDLPLAPTDTARALVITTPAADSTLAATPVVVQGTCMLQDVTGVTLNDAPATYANGAFEASVTLVEGSNTLTAKATTGDGLEVSTSVVVNYDAGCGCATGALGPLALAGLVLVPRRSRRRELR